MLDFSAQKLQPNAFSGQPSTFIDGAPLQTLAQILSIDLVENGDPVARDSWVRQQLFNLMSHARVHSRFWAARLDRKPLNNLAHAPVLRRGDLDEQVRREGCLPLVSPHRSATQNATSGSTGVAARFFISDMNALYNSVRGLAQYLFEGRSLALNRVALSHVNVADKKGYAIVQAAQWAGPLAQIFRNGGGRTVSFAFPDFAQLGEELARKPCGYFNSIPPLLMLLHDAMGREQFQKLQIREFISRGQHIPAEARALCEACGIRVRDTYSCEEAGPLAFECPAFPGAFHVATSNVVIECDEDLIEVDGAKVGKLLVTHLHSYATPFIRYEIGDLGALAPECRCGHRGPVISRLHGRVVSFLRHRNGALTSFVMPASFVEEILPAKEFRVRQTSLDRLVIEIIPRAEPAEAAMAAIANLLRSRFGSDFDVDVRIVERIDWGAGYKRMAFRCEI